MLHLPIYNLIPSSPSRIVSHFTKYRELNVFRQIFKHTHANTRTHTHTHTHTHEQFWNNDIESEINCCKQDNSWTKKWVKIHINFNLIILIFTAILLSTLGKKFLVIAHFVVSSHWPCYFLMFSFRLSIFIMLFGIPLYVSGSFGLPPSQVDLRFCFHKFRSELPAI